MPANICKLHDGRTSLTAVDKFLQKEYGS